ncbi:nucleotidyltransferase family protein [Nocardioides currus]|nr:nucleotidyltransferase family protein [Nocardioides currus]
MTAASHDPGEPASAKAVSIPLAARVHLAHAVVQHLAERAGADLLHIKGPALLPDLRPATRSSSDVDVLVRPTHLHLLVAALEGAGWTKRSDFATGSVFAHAANWWHDDWGYVDVHVHWPGVRLPPEVAYAAWSADAETLDIAHVPCPVPDRTGQLLVLVLHAARSTDRSDVEYAWDNADAEQQAAVRTLARTLDAEVALAAALGELEQFRDDPAYELWRLFSQGGGTRFQEWRARFIATPGTRERAQLLAASFRVNRDHLGMELGRTPTRRDLRERQLLRVRRAARELRGLLGSRSGGTA